MNLPRQSSRITQQQISTARQRGEESQQQSSLPNDSQAIRIGTKRRNQENDNQSGQVPTRKHRKHIPQSITISNSTDPSNDDHVFIQFPLPDQHKND
jgi:hypothetical protein